MAVNVRDAAKITGRLVTTIKVGTRVAITKLQDGWGLVDGKGWVYMQYVKLDAGAEEAIKNGSNAGGNSKGDAPVTTYTNVSVVGKIQSGKEATMYAAALEKAGTEILTLVEKSEFTVSDRTVINNTVWYKATVGSYTGWVKGDTVDLPAITGTVKVNSLNVYKSASLDSEVKDTLVLNTKVTIAENGQVTDGIYVWGRLQSGEGYVQMNNLTLNVQISGGSQGISVGVTPITGKTNGWYQILCNGRTGYVSAEFVVVQDNDTVTKPDGDGSDISPNPLGQEIVEYALQYVGYPYVYGTAGPNTFDCSGFTYYVYYQSGYTLNRSSRDQVKNGVAISKEDLQQGDLVFFSTNGQYPTHVGLYIGDNNIVHASTPQDGVKISSLDTSYYMDNYFAARRIL